MTYILAIGSVLLVLAVIMGFIRLAASGLQGGSKAADRKLWIAIIVFGAFK